MAIQQHQRSVAYAVGVHAPCASSSLKRMVPPPEPPILLILSYVPLAHRGTGGRVVSHCSRERSTRARYTPRALCQRKRVAAREEGRPPHLLCHARRTIVGPRFSSSAIRARSAFFAPA